jgi:hypothetical protein
MSLISAGSISLDSTFKDLLIIFIIIRQENDFLYSEINTQYDQMLATER